MDQTSNPSYEQTFVLIKPDGVARGLIGEVIGRLERKGLRIEIVLSRTVNQQQAEKHYADHIGKPYFEALTKSLTDGLVITMCVSGLNAVQSVRGLVGATAGFNAVPGTIRGDFSNSQRMNIIHASSSLEEAKRELNLWFSFELVSAPNPVQQVDKKWNYTPEEGG